MVLSRYALAKHPLITQVDMEILTDRMARKRSSSTNRPADSGNQAGYIRIHPIRAGLSFVARDGSSSVFTSSTPITDPVRCSSVSAPVSGTLVTRNGTAYSITDGYVSSIRDRNGNLITYQTDIAGNDTIIDPLGELIPSLAVLTALRTGIMRICNIRDPKAPREQFGSGTTASTTL